MTILLTGNGGVGKTAFLRKLTENPHNKKDRDELYGSVDVNGTMYNVGERLLCRVKNYEEYKSVIFMCSLDSEKSQQDVIDAISSNPGIKFVICINKTDLNLEPIRQIKETKHPVFYCSVNSNDDLFQIFPLLI